MASVDDVRRNLLKVAKDIDKQAANAAQVTAPPPKFPPGKNKSAVINYESKLMNSFHVGDPITNQINIAKYITSDSGCHNCVIVRILENNVFRIYFRGVTPCNTPETYNLEDFACLRSVITSRRYVVQSDEDYQALSLLVQWKPLFSNIPDVVIAIPILKVTDQKVIAVVGLGFKKKLPSDFMMTKLPSLKDFLDTVVPYAMTIQATTDYDEDVSRMKVVLQALDVVENHRAYPLKCAVSIGTELAKLAGSCQFIFIFTVDYADNMLHRIYGTGKTKSGQWACPQSDCHEREAFKMDDRLPVGWAASHRKPLRINDSSDCAEFNLPKKGLHSVASCSCKNVLCIPVHDHSGEKNLVIELSDKDGGFTVKDLEAASLFVQNAASIYSCCVMLAHREKSTRRNSILSQILLNIQPVKHMRVEQFLSHQRRNAQANLYSGVFLEFNFSIKNFSEWDMSGGILHAFTDMDFLTIFKIRRATLIRFILSAQQGYRNLPYHNWQHACSVAHFGYVLIKRLKLLEDGYLTPLQAFALIVSSIVHDIDHRGTNNRFQSCTNSDLFQLYNTQESILERHHLAISLSILRREDCNLIENLNPTDYREFIELLTWNILATDISKYLQSRESNFRILKDFKKSEKEHTFALLSLMMTACDVNDCVKTWEDNLVSARHILTEFFDQGDLEKEMGMMPMAMMDRKKAYIPEVEYKFLKGIVTPVYTELAGKFSELQPCVSTLNRFADYWEYSTIVFNSYPDVVNKLDILKWSQLKEENLKRLGNGDLSKVRKLGDKRPDTKKSMAGVSEGRKTLKSKPDIAASEFRKMFSDTDPEPEETETVVTTNLEEIDGGGRTSCCNCLKKKNKSKS